MDLAGNERVTSGFCLARVWRSEKMMAVMARAKEVPELFLPFFLPKACGPGGS